MGKSLSYDIAAILILTLLLISCIVRKLTRGTPNRVFLVFISVNWVATLFDIWAVFLDNAGSTSMSALYMAHTGYLIVHSFTALIYVLYVISLTDTWHKIKKNLLIQFFLWAPYLSVFALLMTNPFTKKIFLVEGGYERGEWFSLIYAEIALYMFFAFGYMIYYRELLEFSKFCAVIAYIPIGAVALWMQMHSPTTVVEMFSSAISLLVISMGAQRRKKSWIRIRSS